MKKCLKYNLHNKSSIRTNIILFSALIILSCCASVHQTTNQSDNNTTDKSIAFSKYEILAKKKYSGDLLFIPNSNNTYMLCISNNKPTNDNPFPSFNFFIYDLKTEKIIYEDSYENGNVNWKNNDQLMIHTFPAQIRNSNDQPILYIYDIKKKKKYIDEIIWEK